MTDTYYLADFLSCYANIYLWINVTRILLN